MTHNTERQEVVAQITGRSVASIRHMQAHSYAPWFDEEFEAGKHRRYSAQHALALVLAEMLTKQGITAEDASEFVRHHTEHVVRFLDKTERGEAAEPESVIALYEAVEDSLTGPRWQKSVGLGGTDEDVLSAVKIVLARVGKTRDRDNGRTLRNFGGPHLAVASIPEAYRLLKLRAEAAGFGVDGRRIYKLETGE